MLQVASLTAAFCKSTGPSLHRRSIASKVENASPPMQKPISEEIGRPAC
jgi:hypothetical protein